VIRVIATVLVAMRRLIELSFALAMLAMLLVGTLIAAPFLIVANWRAERKHGRMTVKPMR
jgi:hypothetical protein